MKKLMIALGIVIFGLLLSIPLHFMKESNESNLLTNSSDVERYDHHIKVNTDSWKGYKILCGDVMKNNASTETNSF